MRHYYRCQDCLSVGVTNEYYDPAKLVCGLCEGKTEYMGKVSQDHLVKTEVPFIKLEHTNQELRKPTL